MSTLIYYLSNVIKMFKIIERTRGVYFYRASEYFPRADIGYFQP
jgi:hypothetical protein